MDTLKEKPCVKCQLVHYSEHFEQITDDRLRDFIVGVGNEFDEASFDPESFSQCYFYPGNLLNRLKHNA